MKLGGFRRKRGFDALPFGKRIKAARDHQGLSLADLASKSGISEKTIRRIEQGANSYEHSRIQLATGLGILYEDLLRPVRPRRIVIAAGTAAAIALAVVAWGGWRLALELATVHHHDNVVEMRLGSLAILKKEFSQAVLAAEVTPWHGSPPLIAVSTAIHAGYPGVQVLELPHFKERWHYLPSHKELLETFPPELLADGGMQCEDFVIADLEGDDDPEIVAVFRHTLWHPCSIEILRRDGSKIANYHHCGHINEVVAEDVDKDGKTEILLAGTNNSAAYQGATILLLDDEHCSGSSTDANALSGCSRPDSAKVRVVFPAFDPGMMHWLGVPRIEGETIFCSTDPQGNVAISLGIRCGAQYSKHALKVSLSSDLQPLSITLTDVFRQELDRAVQARELPSALLSPAYWEAWLSGCFRFEAGHWPPKPLILL